MTTRKDIAAELDNMTRGAQIAGDEARVAIIDAARLMLPNEDPPAEWATFIRLLLTATFDGPWQGVSIRDLMFAAELATMCRNAFNDNMTLPADVKAIYDAGYTGKRERPRKPHNGKLGNRPYVAGAFAIARGYYKGSGGLDGAKQEIVRNKVLELGERAGLTFVGLERRGTR